VPTNRRSIRFQGDFSPLPASSAVTALLPSAVPSVRLGAGSLYLDGDAPIVSLLTSAPSNPLIGQADSQTSVVSFPF